MYKGVDADEIVLHIKASSIVVREATFSMKRE
jgi:hypothetical protein